jgi:hypothetical protein
MLIKTLALALTLIGQGTGLDGITGSIDKSANQAAKDTQKAADSDAVRLGPGGKMIIDGKSKKVKRDCGSLDVQVSGSGNNVSLSGECKNVSVEGEKNTVQVNTAATIAVGGKSNKVYWATKLNGAAPQITKSGTKNTVSQKKGH